MDKLTSKSFRIVLAADSNIWAGADNCDDCTTTPVVTGGYMQNWSCKDGCLVLNDTWFCKYEGNDVVVTTVSGECTKWELVPVLEGTKSESPTVPAGAYEIRLPGTPLAWTATSFAPMQPIILAAVGSVNSNLQTWNIELSE